MAYSVEIGRRLRRENKLVILIQETVVDEDVDDGNIFEDVAGIVTFAGGHKSPAAVAARKRGVPAVTGVNSFGAEFDSELSILTLCISSEVIDDEVVCVAGEKKSSVVLKNGDLITIDGTVGNIYGNF